jgi:hypothetical protein
VSALEADGNSALGFAIGEAYLDVMLDQVDRRAARAERNRRMPLKGLLKIDKLGEEFDAQGARHIRVTTSFFTVAGVVPEIPVRGRG